MSLHFTSKHQVSTIMSQKFTQVLENFTTPRHNELTESTKYFPHIFQYLSCKNYQETIKNQQENQ
jgi:hypothetical protein